VTKAGAVLDVDVTLWPIVDQAGTVTGACALARDIVARKQGAGVGGDWYDLIPLGAGRTGVLVGDVMGRGLEAAAVMGRLRSANWGTRSAGLGKTVWFTLRLP
jgi:serine phosphatase RsbU (regulator of sigma subunit)